MPSVFAGIGEAILHWEERVSCSVCAQQLGRRFTWSEHHCRSCGCIACDVCAPHEIQLREGNVKDRVCNKCVRVVSMVPQLLAQQRAINRQMHEACGTQMEHATTLSEALIDCEKAAHGLIEQSPSHGAAKRRAPMVFRLDAEVETYHMDTEIESWDNEWEDVSLDSPRDVTHKSEFDTSSSILVNRFGEIRRVRWSWNDGFGSRIFSHWMNQPEALFTFLVMQHVHSCPEHARLHLEFADPTGGTLCNSVADAIVFAEGHDAGLVQWMWGDIALPGARLNPLRWSERNNPLSITNQLMGYMGTQNASRSVRMLAFDTKFLTLADTIALLSGSLSI